jgi:hypothetical protein
VVAVAVCVMVAAVEQVEWLLKVLIVYLRERIVL